MSARPTEYCIVCGKPTNRHLFNRFCSFECKRKKRQIDKNNHYDKYYANKDYRQLMFELAKRKALIEDSFNGFDSYAGITKQKKSQCFLTEQDAKEFGLQPVLNGSILYWNPQTKALYLKDQDKYLALTAEF